MQPSVSHHRVARPAPTPQKHQIGPQIHRMAGQSGCGPPAARAAPPQSRQVARCLATRFSRGRFRGASQAHDQQRCPQTQAGPLEEPAHLGAGPLSALHEQATPPFPHFAQRTCWQALDPPTRSRPKSGSPSCSLTMLISALPARLAGQPEVQRCREMGVANISTGLKPESGYITANADKVRQQSNPGRGP